MGVSSRVEEKCIIFLVCISINTVAGFEFTEYVVPCTTNTKYCECPLQYKGRAIDVCIFSLKIKLLQTFTRYEIDPITDEIIVRKGGSVWYIDEDRSEFKPFQDNSQQCSRNLSDTIQCTEPLSVDGKSFRSVITVNGHFPGPTLIANYNQTLVMNITNLLESQTTSVHFHGMHQRRTNWMDGVEQTTQCGIAPGNTFTQIFQADPPGTFWYHSHTGGQRTEGLFGALIIKELQSVMEDAQSIIGLFNDQPHEHTFTLLDFYDTSLFKLYYLIHIETPLYFTNKSPDPNSYTPFGFTSSVDGAEVGPIPFWSGLINSHGRHPQITYAKSKLSIFTIGPSERYRFRVIGSQNGFAFRISIDEHRLTVMSTDGALLKPVEVDFLIVQAGERYDFIIDGKSDAKLSDKYDFMIRAETLETYPPENENQTRQPIKGHMAEAILHYKLADEPNPSQYSTIADYSKSVETTCTLDQPCIALNCPFRNYPSSYNITCMHIHQLELLFPIPDKALPNIQPEEYLFFNIGFEGSSQTSSFNARNHKIPSSPLSLLNETQLQDLLSVEGCKRLDDPEMCDDALDVVLASNCICTHTRNLPFNSSLQLVYTSVSPNPEYTATYRATHPVHLHGHYFQVMDIKFGEYSPSGLLSSPNKDIYCGGAESVCTVPQWAQGKDFSIGRTGKINNTAPLKDSLAIPSGGYAVTYLRTDNPGHWFSHCHIENHQLAGMSVILSEAVDRIEPPPKKMPTCGNVILDVPNYLQEIWNEKQSQQNQDPSPIKQEECNSKTGIAILIPLCVLVIILVLVQAVLCYCVCFRSFK